MNSADSKVTVHMVSSVDGFIARRDERIEWMQSDDRYEKGVTLTEEQIADFLQSIDCYVMGSRTYEQALQLGWPYGDVPVFVLTHRKLITDRSNVKFVTGDLKAIVQDLKLSFRNIWMVGGSGLAKEFFRQSLVDEIVMSVIPVILGDGLLFFDYVGIEQPLHLKDLRAYKDGMIELWYEIR